MLDDRETACRRNTRLEDIAAALTNAVYPFVLRHGTRGRWLDVQLGLWRALIGALEEMGRETSSRSYT